MLGTIVLALMGAGFVVGLVDMFDNDNDEDALPEDDGDTGIVRTETMITGTDGDDNVALSNNPADQLIDTIDLLEGVDVVSLAAETDGVTVDGGAGDDVIISQGLFNTLIGGDGDDVIEALNATDVDGGAGNDVIVVDQSTMLIDGTGLVFGGDGDDVIEVISEAGEIGIDIGGVVVDGGAGADSVNFILSLDEQLDTDPDGTVLEVDGGTVGRIVDFDPTEDTLMISVERTEGSEDREVLNVALREDAVDAGSIDYTVLVSFAGSAASSPSTTEIRVTSTAPLTLDDIFFDTDLPPVGIAAA